MPSAPKRRVNVVPVGPDSEKIESLSQQYRNVLGMYRLGSSRKYPACRLARHSSPLFSQKSRIT